MTRGLVGDVLRRGRGDAGEDDPRALDRGRGRGTSLDLQLARLVTQRRAFGRIVEEDVVGRDVEMAGGEEFLAEALADLAEADEGDTAGIDGMILSLGRDGRL